jgi:hypothetical protein
MKEMLKNEEVLMFSVFKEKSKLKNEFWKGLKEKPIFKNGLKVSFLPVVHKRYVPNKFWTDTPNFVYSFILLKMPASKPIPFPFSF